MSKLSMFAGAAVVAVGLASLSSGSAFAMGCLRSDLPPMGLTHSDTVPNAGFGYNKDVYLQQQANGNTCGTTQQSYSVTKDRFQTDPNNAKKGDDTSLDSNF